jgi:uncharacterized protein (UPF0335 family)
MVENYRTQREWADYYIQEQLNILKYIYQVEDLHEEITTIQQDTKECTDIIIKINNEEIKIGLRVRKPDKLKYQDITFRSYREGCKTELDKMDQFLGNYNLYCWTDETKEIVRFAYIQNSQELVNFLRSKKTKMNKDGITGFVRLTFPEIKRFKGIIKEKK